MNNIEFIINTNPVIVKYNVDNKYYLVFNNILGYQNGAELSIFFKISDKMFDELNSDMPNVFYNLKNKDIDEIINLISDSFGTFIFGEDYFISKSLIRYITNYNDDNIFISSSNIQGIMMEDYIDDSFNRINLNVYTDIVDTNLGYFNMLNKLIDFTFSQEELMNFCSTFCSIILDYTTLDNISDIKNQIYKYVLEYWKNHGKDDVSIALDLVLNSTILGTSPDPSKSCCTSSNTITNSLSSLLGQTNNNTIANTQIGSSIIEETCKEKYDKAMLLYLQNMLADYDFYCDWFYIYDDITNISIPNMNLIERLKKLFEEFKDLNIPLSFTSTSTKCGCKDLSNTNSSIYNESESNYKILDNYYYILEWCENETLCNNKNKMKVYGNNFGKLLPYLYF